MLLRPCRAIFLSIVLCLFITPETTHAKKPNLAKRALNYTLTLAAIGATAYGIYTIGIQGRISFADFLNPRNPRIDENADIAAHQSSAVNNYVQCRLDPMARRTLYLAQETHNSVLNIEQNGARQSTLELTRATAGIAASQAMQANHHAQAAASSVGRLSIDLESVPKNAAQAATAGQQLQQEMKLARTELSQAKNEIGAVAVTGAIAAHGAAQAAVTAANLSALNLDAQIKTQILMHHEAQGILKRLDGIGDDAKEALQASNNAARFGQEAVNIAHQSQESMPKIAQNAVQHAVAPMQQGLLAIYAMLKRMEKRQQRDSFVNLAGHLYTHNLLQKRAA